MITPIAKCSIKVSMATKTHSNRWDLCSPFLLQEIDALVKADLLCPNFFMLTVGNHPDGVLTKGTVHEEILAAASRETHSLWRIPCGKFKIAAADKKAFAQFLEEHESDYRAFVTEHVWWDQDKLDREFKRDMEILFKWNQEMDPWREHVQ